MDITSEKRCDGALRGSQDHVLGDMTKLKNAVIEGARVVLKPITTDDVTERYCSWLNNGEITRGLVTKKITFEGLTDYVEEKIMSNDCMFFTISIRLESELKHIGNVKLDSFDLTDKVTTLGILIGEKDYHGKGIGTEVIRLTVDFLRRRSNFRKIILGVEIENVAAVNLYRKVGFVTYEETETSYKMEYVL